MKEEVKGLMTLIIGGVLIGALLGLFFAYMRSNF